MGLKLDGTTGESRRAAAAVLEVLAGVRTPAQAAQSLGLSLVGYYKLEGRAIKGLIDQCGTPARGPRPSADQQVRRLQKQCRQLENDMHRYQALARSAQRVAGLAQVAQPAANKADARGRRKRKPAVRALKAIRSLRQAGTDDTVAAPQPPTSPMPETPS
jgi:hypothetical protein